VSEQSKTKKPVQISITKERKQRWKRAAEERVEFRSLTDLIVVSVERELQDGAATSGVTEDGDMRPVQDDLDLVKDKLDCLEDRLDETYFLVREEESQYLELTSAIQEIIPTGERDEIVQRQPASTDSAKESAEQTGSVSHLVQYLQREYDVSGSQITQAVEGLEQDVGAIETAWAKPQEEDDKRMFRRGDA
jgi:hypothetical protein